MSEASIIINVSEVEYLHNNGLGGTFTIPPKPDILPSAMETLTSPVASAGHDPRFGLLVIYPTREIQDIGEGRKDIHWLKARPVAKDVVGMNSDADMLARHPDGTKGRIGVLLCEAEPDIPKTLERAIEEEIEFLNSNRPEVRYQNQQQASGARLMVAVNVWNDPHVPDRMVELGRAVEEERIKFHAHCRTLVRPDEVKKARDFMMIEYKRLVESADRMWATPTQRNNVSDIHRRACRSLRMEKEWCYTPKELMDCPGCGSAIKIGVIRCPSCFAILDEEPETYAKMSNKEKAMRLYPENYAQEEAPAGPPRRQQR